MKSTLAKIWHFLSKHFQLIAAVLTIAGIAWALYSQRQAIADFRWDVRPWYIVGALLLMAMGPIFQALSFWDALRAFGPRPSLIDVVLIWSRSFLLRYSPTGALAFVYRVRQATKLQADNKEILAATAYEQYSALQAGLTLAVVGFWLDGGSIPIWAVGLFTAGLLIALLARPNWLGGAVKRMMDRRGVALPDLLRGRRVVPIVLFNIVAWSFVALGNWLLLQSLAPGAEVSFLYFSASFLLACAIGIIVPMLPGGIGVREGMLIILLAPVMPAAVATAVAIGLRIIATGAEFVAIGLAELAHLGQNRLAKK